MIVSIPGTRPHTRGHPVVRALACAAAALGLWGCDESPVDLDRMPFGRTGTVSIEVRTPLPTPARAPTGELYQILTWSSSGPWTVTERILYDRRLGDETVRKSTEDPSILATRYANWIRTVNDSLGPVGLFDRNRLAPDLVPTCVTGSTVTVHIHDRALGDSIAWSRCGSGSLIALTSEGSGPGPDAARVVEAARLVREATLALQPRFEYAYTGSRPFRTLERGEQSRATLLVPRVIEDPSTWASFWSEHKADGSAAPAVDFGTDLVLIGAVGVREEAGDSVEVRRILPVGFATQITLFERRPGHFCTPAPRAHAPFHIVVAPHGGLPRPIFFSVDKLPDQVSCG